MQCYYDNLTSSRQLEDLRNKKLGVPSYRFYSVHKKGNSEFF